MVSNVSYDFIFRGVYLTLNSREKIKNSKHFFEECHKCNDHHSYMICKAHSDMTSLKISSNLNYIYKS